MSGYRQKEAACSKADTSPVKPISAWEITLKTARLEAVEGLARSSSENPHPVAWLVGASSTAAAAGFMNLENFRFPRYVDFILFQSLLSLFLLSG